jgi:hypothetical protein
MRFLLSSCYDRGRFGVLCAPSSCPEQLECLWHYSSRAGWFLLSGENLLAFLKQPLWPIKATVVAVLFDDG